MGEVQGRRRCVRIREVERGRSRKECEIRERNREGKIGSAGREEVNVNTHVTEGANNGFPCGAHAPVSPLPGGAGAVFPLLGNMSLIPPRTLLTKFGH